MNSNDAEIKIKTRPTESHACERCGGSGRVLTPRWLAPLYEMPSYIVGGPADAIPAVVLGMASIFEACRAAVVLADDNARPVVFDFNEITVVVKPGDNWEQIGRDWWQKKYDETPEETHARR